MENLTTVVNTLDSLHICPGNLEMEFIQLSIKSIMDNSKICKVKVKILSNVSLNYTGVTCTVAYLEKIPLVTVRHKSCLFLTPSDKRCQYCNEYRKFLFASLSRAKTNNKKISTYTNYVYRHLDDNQKIKYLQLLKKENKKTNEIITLKSKLDSYAKQNTVLLTKDQHDDSVSTNNE